MLHLLCITTWCLRMLDLKSTLSSLAHQQKDFLSFNYFASTLMSHDCQVCNVLKIGTDGEKATVEAFVHNFPFALQLRCFIHLRRNIEEKLGWIGTPRDGSCISFRYFWLAGFFWAVYSEVLVDSGSEEEFDTALWRLENHLWKTLCDSKWATVL